MIISTLKVTLHSCNAFQNDTQNLNRRWKFGITIGKESDIGSQYQAIDNWYPNFPIGALHSIHLK